MSNATQQYQRWRRFRYIAAAAIVLLIAQGAPPVRAQGAGTPPITLTFQPLIGGDYETGTVTLGQPMTTDLKVEVMSSSKDAKIAPLTQASLDIKAGQTIVTFQIISSPVKSPEKVLITACAPSPSPYPCPAPGTPNMLQTVATLVLSPNGPASVSVNPGSIKAGNSTTGTVTLKYPAPKDILYYANIAPFPQPKQYVKTLRKGGAVVTLTSTGGVSVPTSINVSQGGSSATFTASSPQSAASAPQGSSCVMGPSALTATITATWELSASGTLQVQPQDNSKSRYTSKTIRIDPSTIVGVSHDAQVIVLKGSPCVNSLEAGDVVYFKKLGVLNVGAVKKLTTPPNEVAIGVSSAGLTNFINDGTLQLLKETPQTASEPGGSNNPGNRWADTAEPYHEQSPGEQPWKYTTSGTSSSYSFTAFKENGGLSASVSGKGQVNGGYNFLVVIHGDKVEQSTFTVPTDGTLDVDWMAQTTASGQGIGESRLRMPPLYSGLVDDATDDIPFLFQIYANFIFKPGFGEKAAAKGHFQITYKGEGGIDGSSAVNTALDATPGISSTTSSAKAPHGVVVAVNAPRFAMAFSNASFLWAVANRLPSALNMKGADFADSLEAELDEKVEHDVEYPDPDDYFKLPLAAYVQWVSSVAYAGQGSMGAGLLSPVPCQQYYQNYLVQAGIDKDMLGSISGSVPPEDGVEVFKKTGVSAIPSIQGCMPK